MDLLLSYRRKPAAKSNVGGLIRQGLGPHKHPPVFLVFPLEPTPERPATPGTCTYTGCFSSPLRQARHGHGADVLYRSLLVLVCPSLG